MISNKIFTFSKEKGRAALKNFFRFLASWGGKIPGKTWKKNLTAFHDFAQAAKEFELSPSSYVFEVKKLTQTFDMGW